MRVYLAGLTLLTTVAFSLASWLEPWFQSWEGSRSKSANVIQVALGDSRKLFARQFYLKADAYFHNGYYPTIYDKREGFEKPHIHEEISAQQEEDEAFGETFLGAPKDWIDRFSRHFYPSRHTHLGDSGCGHSCCQRPKSEHTHSHPPENESASGGQEREILPWLRLSATLDPERPETYVVASYWLRSHLGKVDEAERFLREGLQANPGASEILFELGRIYEENRQDPTRARNVWELALQHWRERQANEPDPDLLLGAQILGHLAKLEEKQHHRARAIEHLQALKLVSPNKESIQKWIEEVAKQADPKEERGQ